MMIQPVVIIRQTAHWFSSVVAALSVSMGRARQMVMVTVGTIGIILIHGGWNKLKTRPLKINCFNVTAIELGLQESQQEPS